MKVELNDSGIFINGKAIAFPINHEALSEIIGQPSRAFYDNNDWRRIWDDLGVYASGIDINSLMFIVKPEEWFNYNPEHPFAGEMVVNGKPIQDYTDGVIKVKRYQASQLRHMGEDVNAIFAYGLGKNYDYEEEPSETPEVETIALTGTPIVFADLNFKLAVVQVLMYEQKVLKPDFDVYAFARTYKDRQIEVNKEGYAPIPEALEYFKNLEVDQAFAEKITSLEQDGGNDIYMEIAPLWNGEDDIFNIKSVEDTASFPNLKEMTLFYDEDGDALLEELRAKGIEADWL